MKLKNIIRDYGSKLLVLAFFSFLVAVLYDTEYWLKFFWDNKALMFAGLILSHSLFYVFGCYNLNLEKEEKKG